MHALKRPFLLCLLVAPVLFCISCSSKQVGPNEALLTEFPSYGAAPMVRVLLVEASSRTTLKVECQEASVVMDGRSVDAASAMTVNRGETGAHWELIPGGAPQAFSLDGRTYRGKLRIVATPKGWEVINIVDLEQYVAGVIGWEMMRNWPVEALAVQAVASRTYALFSIQERRNSGDNWDIDDSTRFQVYGGVGPTQSPKLWRESENVLRARELTSGQVLTYKGKGFKAFFHSTSGGTTTSPEAAFGIRGGLEPLNGSNLGEFCKESPKFTWTVRLGKGELNARLIEWRVGISDCIRISVRESAPSGHAMSLRLFSRDGKSVEVRATDFRFKMGLPSTQFEAAREGDEWVFTGKGHGHGCGMCQWSAHGMAKAGWPHDKILRTMYPGAQIETLY